MFSALPAAKLVTQVVAGVGVSKIVGDIVANNVIITTPVQKITVRVGSFVLASMLWDQSSNYIEDLINEIVDKVKELKEKNTEETDDASTDNIGQE